MCNLSFEENFLVIRVGDIMKTSNKKLHIGEIKFPQYQENDKTCVLYMYERILKLIVNLRLNITHLFITTTKIIFEENFANNIKLLPKTP